MGRWRCYSGTAARDCLTTMIIGVLNQAALRWHILVGRASKSSHFVKIIDNIKHCNEFLFVQLVTCGSEMHWSKASHSYTSANRTGKDPGTGGFIPTCLYKK